MLKVSRRKPTLIIVPTQAKSFVFKASILWNTYQTLPEGRDIRDFIVGISFLKNIIKSLLLKRQKIGDEVELHPSKTLILLTLDPHCITKWLLFLQEMSLDLLLV